MGARNGSRVEDKTIHFEKRGRGSNSNGRIDRPMKKDERGRGARRQHSGRFLGGD